MPVLINLKNYLADLERDELAKPKDKQRTIPTLQELASEVGLHRMSFLRIANNQIKHLNLEVADKIISAMHRRGFDMEVSDLLVYREPSNHKPN